MCLVIAGVLAAVLGAQDKPDFSGRWLLDSSSPPAADIARAMSVRQTVTSANARGEPVTPFFSGIEIRREFETGVRTEHREIGIIGGVVGGIDMIRKDTGSGERFAVTWDGLDLVFEISTNSRRGGEAEVWTERREVWSLDATGRLRVMITTRGSNVEPSTATIVYGRND